MPTTVSKKGDPRDFRMQHEMGRTALVGQETDAETLEAFKAVGDSFRIEGKRNIITLRVKWSTMAHDASHASARLLALLAATKHKAQDLQMFIARCVLLHGLPFVQRLCRQLALFLHHASRTASHWTVGSPWQHPDLNGTRLAADRLLKRALASAVLALNSSALKIAARQVISISLSRGQDGVAGQAYTLHLRLLGGLFW